MTENSCNFHNVIFGFQDEISGGSVERTEERDGLSLTGEYSYSDGFFKRTGT